MEAGAAVLNESVIYLPQVGSTNAWAKENIAQFGPVGAVYTTDQTAGRGRLGRSRHHPHGRLGLRDGCIPRTT